MTTSVLELLDASTAETDDRWFDDVKRSLSMEPEQWVDAVRVSGVLTMDQAWSLLAWVEIAATVLTRERSIALLESATFARSLLTASELDRRDVGIVEALLRRGAHVGGVSFLEGVESGCAKAAEFGAAGRRSLLRAPTKTPATHVEVGEGLSFSFRRRPAGFDVQELERWLSDYD
jgi:hypothetical protein